MRKSYYVLIVFLAGCCYGILSTFVKLAYGAGFQLADVAGSQCLTGTLLLWLAWLFTKKTAVSGRNVVKLLLCGVPFAMTSIFYYHSLQTLNASLAVVLLFQFVWLGTLFDSIYYKRMPSRQKAVSIGILLVGSVLAAGVTADGDFTPSIGMLWGFLSAITYTLSMLGAGAVANEVQPVLKSALIAAGSSCVIFMVMPPVFLLNTEILPHLLPYGLLLGFFGVTLPPFLFAVGMPHVGPGLGTILTSSELPVAVLMSLFVLGESVTVYQLLGIALIIGGIAIGNIPGKLTGVGQ